MHRPRIASVRGDTIVLDGTTIEEVKQYHRDTLVLCVNEANKLEAQIAAERQRSADKARERSEAHRKNIQGFADDIDFD